MVGDILQPTHLLFVLVVALLVLGPKRLPEVGKTLGSGIRDFRQAISGEAPDHSHDWSHTMGEVAEPQTEPGHETHGEPEVFDGDPATLAASEVAPVADPHDAGPGGTPQVAHSAHPAAGDSPAVDVQPTVAAHAPSESEPAVTAQPVASRSVPTAAPASRPSAQPIRPVGQPIRQGRSARPRPSRPATPSARPTAAGETGQPVRSIPRPGQPIRSTSRSARPAARPAQPAPAAGPAASAAEPNT